MIDAPQGINLTADHLTSIAAWLGGAAVGIAGFFAAVVRWMMVRVERSQSDLLKRVDQSQRVLAGAVGDLRQTVDLMRQHVSLEDAVHNQIIASQQNILLELGKVLGAVRVALGIQSSAGDPTREPKGH